MKERRRAIASGGKLELERSASPYEELVRGEFINPDGSLTANTKHMLSRPVGDDIGSPFAWLRPDYHYRCAVLRADREGHASPREDGYRASALDQLTNNNRKPMLIGSSVVTYDISRNELSVCDNKDIVNVLYAIRDCMAGEPQKEEARTPLDYAKSVGYVAVGGGVLAIGTHAWLGPMPALFAGGLGALGGIIASEYPRKSRLRPERLATMEQLIRQAALNGKEVRTVDASGTLLFVPAEHPSNSSVPFLRDWGEVAADLFGYDHKGPGDRLLTDTEHSDLKKNSFEYYWDEILEMARDLEIPHTHSIGGGYGGLKVTEPVLVACILSNDTYRDVWGEVLDLIRDREEYEQSLCSIEGYRHIRVQRYVRDSLDFKPNFKVREIFLQYQARWLKIMNKVRSLQEQSRLYDGWRRVEEFLTTITEEDASHPARRGVKEELWRVYNSGKVEQTPENLQLFASAVYTFTAAADESDPDWHGLYKEIWDDGGEVLGLMTPKDFEARYFNI